VGLAEADPHRGRRRHQGPSALATSVAAWKQGSYGIVGYGGDSGNLDYPTIESIKGSAYSKDLLTQPRVEPRG